MELNDYFTHVSAQLQTLIIPQKYSSEIPDDLISDPKALEELTNAIKALDLECIGIMSVGISQEGERNMLTVEVG